VFVRLTRLWPPNAGLQLHGAVLSPLPLLLVWLQPLRLLDVLGMGRLCLQQLLAALRALALVLLGVGVALVLQRPRPLDLQHCSGAAAAAAAAVAAARAPGSAGRGSALSAGASPVAHG
jgi:hypothetical protein